jgi:hypothetical protein
MLRSARNGSLVTDTLVPVAAMYRRGLPRLPALAHSKIDKTGYTRGASTKQIFQNRVTRNNTVLIDWSLWDKCREPYEAGSEYENGYIVLVEPAWYFETSSADRVLKAEGIYLGENALLVFLRRDDWLEYGPGKRNLWNGTSLTPGTARRGSLGGVYIARVHATVAATDGDMCVEGYASKGMRGAGIRVFEYASREVIEETRLQLEALMWLCYDAERVFDKEGMQRSDIATRKSAILQRAKKAGLLSESRLRAQRIVDEDGLTVCPLCLERISAALFFKRSDQALGRATYDLTTTDVSLFHIAELRVGSLQHKTYNLGWGHHHCNIVVKDAGIAKTVRWMQGVMANQP